MRRKLLLTGDINLMGVHDPVVPFSKIARTMSKADAVLSNLECCFYDPPTGLPSQAPWGGLYDRSIQREGFYAPTRAIAALQEIGVAAVGNANNTNYGDEAILSSLRVLNAAGIAHTGAGKDRRTAHESAIIDVESLKIGMIQRTCIYWPHDHEAADNRPGVAALKVNTAYRPRIDLNAANRPGVPPDIVTWTDATYLDEYRGQVEKLVKATDVALVSIHWGYDHQIYSYQIELAHAAIDAGAAIVFGHGPHTPLGVEIYKESPIYYGLGSFSFNIGHHGRKHPDWLGLMAEITLKDDEVSRAGFKFVRHTDQNETILRTPSEESNALEELTEQSKSRGATLIPRTKRVLFLGA